MSNGAMMADSAPQSEPSLEVVNSNTNSARDTITDIEAMVTRIEDYLQGARPEKALGGEVSSCPSGIVAQMCQLSLSNVDRLQDIHRRLDRMAGGLGVTR